MELNDRKKEEVLTLRVTKAERVTLEQAAAERRLTLSGYLARAGLRAAELRPDILAAA